MIFTRKIVRWLMCVGSVVFLLTEPTYAQGLRNLLSSGTTKAAPAPAPTDPLKRETPRSAIYGFLEACHGDNFVRASQYLDLRRIKGSQRVVQGAELAKELCELLNRNPQFEVQSLSNAPEGDFEDGLEPDLDNLAIFQLNGEPVQLQLQRVMQQGMQVWLVSADSVQRIPDLAPLVGESAIEKKLPRPLVKTKLIGTPLWTWITLVLLGLILSLVSRWLSRVFIALVKPIAKRYSESLRAHRLEAFIEPLRLVLSILVFRGCMEVVAPSALLRDYLLKLIALLFVFGSASIVMRMVDLISDQVTSRLDARQRAISSSVLPLGVRFIKICIFCLAVLITLQAWGYNTTTILAGVGVGGLAVALAAQKTIENLFGGVSVISDRPVLVGDFCQFGGQLGTVEDIGLRSTRIRTLDRTLVTIPNSQFSTMTLENFSQRDRMWFHPTLHLRRDTMAEQIRNMMEAVSKVLEEHPLVDASGVPLRFTKIGQNSFELEIFAYVLTADYNQFLNVQSELLLKMLEIAKALKVEFAVPFQEMLAVPLQKESSTDGYVPGVMEGSVDGEGEETRVGERR
jgi:MscS family membrane protein